MRPQARSRSGSGSVPPKREADAQVEVDATLTPKQRWMHLWQAAAKPAPVPAPAPAPVSVPVSRPVAVAKRAKRARAAQAKVLPAPPAPPDPDEDLEPGEILSDGPLPSGPGLRVRTPTTAAASHLSPAIDRSVAAAASSISPSAKIKELDAIVSRAAQILEQAKPPLSAGSTSTSTSTSGSTSTSTSGSGRLPLELTESERRRLERRKRRKSNWDVQDPSAARASAFPNDVRVPPLRRAHSSMTLAHGYGYGYGFRTRGPGPFWRPPHHEYAHDHEYPHEGLGRRALRHSSSLPLLPRRPPPSRYNTPFGPAYR